MQYIALMDQGTTTLTAAIGARVKQQRQSRRWTLDQLAAPPRKARTRNLSQFEHPIRSSLTDADLGLFVVSRDESLPLDSRVRQVIERCIRLASIAITFVPGGAPRGG